MVSQVCALCGDHCLFWAGSSDALCTECTYVQVYAGKEDTVRRKLRRAKWERKMADRATTLPHFGIIIAQCHLTVAQAYEKLASEHPS